MRNGTKKPDLKAWYEKSIPVTLQEHGYLEGATLGSAFTTEDVIPRLKEKSTHWESLGTILEKERLLEIAAILKMMLKSDCNKSLRFSCGQFIEMISVLKKCFRVDTDPQLTYCFHLKCLVYKCKYQFTVRYDGNRNLFYVNGSSLTAHTHSYLHALKVAGLPCEPSRKKTDEGKTTDKHDHQSTGQHNHSTGISATDVPIHSNYFGLQNANSTQPTDENSDTGCKCDH
ncbi:unnamed protein product [Ambrosiozyma monospora]|uniref:Unnamed protein product n=1 Tax=Ambrosiozyma monospora TaxID=43982 RepID=A0A9W6SYQ5_AMBMO|nr:unnamed protein product [Ambrosiozyma monospora]